MSRWIDADALKKSLEAWAVNLGNPKMLVKEETEIVIGSAPSIDIVRCGECWHSKSVACEDGVFTYFCDISDLKWRADDFCSYGERKDDE